MHDISPFNGDFIGSNGEVRNLLDNGTAPADHPKHSMMPFNGWFYASDGSIHNIDELNTGGGGGGTTNYNHLINRPQIHGVTLAGNLTAAQLGLLAASASTAGDGLEFVNGKINIVLATDNDIDNILSEVFN